MNKHVIIHSIIAISKKIAIMLCIWFEAHKFIKHFKVKNSETIDTFRQSVRKYFYQEGTEIIKYLIKKYQNKYYFP